MTDTDRTPVECFKELKICGAKQYGHCEGSYYPNSSHSNFGEMIERYSERVERMPEGAGAFFYAKFFLGYGVNEIRDFLALRQNLFHFSPTPGDIADVIEYPYNKGDWQAREIQDSDNEGLLQVMRGAQEILTPLHEKMREKWRGIEMRDDFNEVTRLMAEEFGEDLRRVERDLSQRFQSVSDMLNVYCAKGVK